MTTSQADLTVCCSPGSPPEISENILVICVVALGGGAQSPLHRFSRDALLMESHGWRIVETRGGAFPLVTVQFKAKWWITTVLHSCTPNMKVKTTITLMDIGLKRRFINFSFILRGCFWQWEGALPRSGGARAPSKPLILRPCGKRRRPRPDGDSWAVAKAAEDRDVCVVRGMQLNFNFQKTGAQAEIVWLFIFQSLLVVPYRTIE